MYDIHIGLFIYYRKDLHKEASKVEDVKEFVAFSRKLLRSLKQIRQLLEDGEIDICKQLLDDLIEDTQKDIEA